MANSSRCINRLHFETSRGLSASSSVLHKVFCRHWPTSEKVWIYQCKKSPWLLEHQYPHSQILFNLCSICILNYAVILPDFVSPLSSGEENCQPEGDADEEEGEREQGGLVHWELFVQIKHLEHLFLVAYSPVALLAGSKQYRTLQGQFWNWIFDKKQVHEFTSMLSRTTRNKMYIFKISFIYFCFREQRKECLKRKRLQTCWARRATSSLSWSASQSAIALEIRQCGNVVGVLFSHLSILNHSVLSANF